MDTPHPGPSRLEPARFAAAQRELFDGRRMRVGSGRAVHAVAWAPWTEGHQLPMPACRTGWAGHGTAGDLRPTRDPLTCRRCLTLESAAPPDDDSQPGLW